MCGRAYGPRFLWMWPNAKVGVMGGDQLGQVMATISKCVVFSSYRSNFIIKSKPPSDPAKREKLKNQIEHESEALYASARLWDDGIIQPEQTRDVLGLGLAVSTGKPDLTGAGEGRFGVFRM